MKLALAVLVVGVVGLAGAGLGGWLGLTVGILWNRGEFARWQPLPPLPASAARIVTGSPDGVIVETVDGSLLFCDAAGESCWTAATEMTGLTPVGEDCAEYPVGYNVSAPPQQAVDYLTTTWCHFEAGEQTDYALLADGSVWVWTHFNANFLSLFRAFGSSLAGAVAGFVLAAVVTVIGLGFVGRVGKTGAGRPATGRHP